MLSFAGNCFEKKTAARRSRQRPRAPPRRRQHEAGAAVGVLHGDGREDATIIDITKDYFNQLQVTGADTHWACVKNRVRLAEKTSSVTTHPLFSPSPAPLLSASPCSVMDARLFPWFHMNPLLLRVLFVAVPSIAKFGMIRVTLQA
jgi:hypothetical protein